MLWLTFPPMILLLLDRPVGLIIAYGVLGAFFMPFLAVTLLVLLNRRGGGRAAPGGVAGAIVPPEHRNRWFSNTTLVICAALFIAVAVNELRGVIGDYL